MKISIPLQEIDWGLSQTIHCSYKRPGVVLDGSVIMLSLGSVLANTNAHCTLVSTVQFIEYFQQEAIIKIKWIMRTGRKWQK